MGEWSLIEAAGIVVAWLVALPWRRVPHASEARTARLEADLGLPLPERRFYSTFDEWCNAIDSWNGAAAVLVRTGVATPNEARASAGWQKPVAPPKSGIDSMHIETRVQEVMDHGE